MSLTRIPLRLISIALLIFEFNNPNCATAQSVEKPPLPPHKLLLAHYMGWYTAKPFSKSWGWHWTMGHYDPDIEKEGRRPAASHYYPLIGLYDSSDPDVLDCQCLLMKLSGIDGVIIDWYGTDDYLDYAVN